MPGRCVGCWAEEGGGVVTREGLDELDGEDGDEYEREPRLPPLPARAHTVALSSSRSDARESPSMSRRTLGRMVTSGVILARPAV